MFINSYNNEINYFINININEYFKVKDKSHIIKNNECINCKSKFESFKTGYHDLDFFAKSVFKLNLTKDKELSKLTCNEIIIRNILL